MDNDTASGQAGTAVTKEDPHMARKKNRTARTSLAVWAGPVTLLLKLLIEIFKH